MATIVIRDLPDSIELDRKAMLAVSGGARGRARAGVARRTASPNTKIFDLRPARAIPGKASSS